MLKVRVLAILILFGSISVAAQNCELKPKKKAKKIWEKAQKEYGTTVRDMAKDALEIDPDYVEVHYFLARHYIKNAKVGPNMDPSKIAAIKEKAQHHFEEVKRICPSFAGHSANYYLGQIYHKQGKFEQAAEDLRAYLDDESVKPDENKYVAELLEKECSIIIKLTKNPVPYDPRKVKGMNSNADEYLPMLSADNEKLFFTRRQSGPLDKTKPAGQGNDHRELFTVARKLTVDSFSTGFAMGAPFNAFDGQLNGYDVIGQGGACLTPDNKRMFITVVVYQQTKYGPRPNSSIYFSEKRDGNWTPLKSLGDHINDENGQLTWEGQPTISSDGKMIIFASARDASMVMNPKDPIDYHQFSLDLYKINLQDDGTWSAPENLGDVINTPGQEKTPFLHTDSRTLYFSSNGLPGVGGYDLYYARMDDYGNWTEPVNLGTPINDENDQHGFIVSLDGKHGFLTSGEERGPNGGLDIITFPLYEKARPEKVVFMTGTLVDEDGKALKDGKIEIKNPKTGEITQGIVDKETGDYVAVMSVPDPKRVEEEDRKVILKLDGEKVEADYGSHVAKVNGEEKIIPPGAKVEDVNGTEEIIPKGKKVVEIEGVDLIISENQEKKIIKGEEVVAQIPEAEETPDGEFVITASADGVAYSNKVVQVDAEEVDGSLRLRDEEIKVEKFEVNKPIRLNDIVFTTDSYVLNRASRLVLDELTAFLIANPDVKISIQGHTDDVGDNAKNLTLSQNRSDECLNYLVVNGIDASRLKAKGFGETRPKVKNNSSANRAKNRRVEFVILKM